MDSNYIEPAMYPGEFVESVAYGADKYITDYLRGHAPELAELFDGYIILVRYSLGARAGQVTRLDNDHISKTLAAVTRLLADLGHDFITPCGERKSVNARGRKPQTK